MADDAQIVLRAYTAQLDTDLKQATGSVQKFADGMRGVGTNLGVQWQGALIPANDRVKGSIGGLLEKFQDFRREQVQQGRQARFLANEVMSIIPAGDGAKGALEGMAGMLIEGAAGGLSFGLALEGAKLAVGFLASEWKEAAEAAAKFQAGLTKMKDEAGSLALEVWKANLELQGFTPAMVYAAESVKPAEMALADLTDAVDRQRAAVELLKKEELDTYATGNTSQTEGQIAKAEARLAELEQQLAAQEAIVAGRRAQFEGMVGKEEQPAGVKAAEELRAAAATAAQAWEALGERMRQTMAEGANKLVGGPTTALPSNSPDFAGSSAFNAGPDLKAAAKGAEERRAMLQKDGQVYVQLASQLGDVFGRIATGQMSIIAGIKQMISGMVQVVAQGMIELELAIAVAAAKAAGSVSIIPFVGPALGIAAAAAMFSALMAYTPSAATGWDKLPSDQLVQAHRGERILTAYDTERMDRLEAGGMGGATFHIYAHDARSFDQYLRDNRVAVVRALTSAAKDGVRG